MFPVFYIPRHVYRAHGLKVVFPFVWKKIIILFRFLSNDECGRIDAKTLKNDPGMLYLKNPGTIKYKSK